MRWGRVARLGRVIVQLVGALGIKRHTAVGRGAEWAGKGADLIDAIRNATAREDSLQAGRLPTRKDDRK